MNEHLIESVKSRGIVIVVSDSPEFATNVGQMVSASAFTSVPVRASEFVWVPLLGMSPCVVICDCEAPAESLERVFREVGPGPVPLLLSQMGPKPQIAQALRHADRVAWFSFPIAQQAFAATLETVLLTNPSTYRLLASAGGASVDAGISVRDLVGAVPPAIS